MGVLEGFVDEACDIRFFTASGDSLDLKEREGSGRMGLSGKIGDMVSTSSVWPRPSDLPGGTFAPVRRRQAHVSKLPAGKILAMFGME